jgi:hypothetical protein
MPAQPSLLTNVSALPSGSPREVCSHCGQRFPAVFRHPLSKGLLSVLWKMYHAGKPIRLTELGLTNSEFANAQKLNYFKIAQSVDGAWSITERGLLFLGNRIEVERYVFTKQGKVVDREGAIRVSDVDEGWWDKYQFARERRA